MKKAVLSFSGGLDSTCLLLHLLANDYEVKCFSFNYGQRHSIELEKSKQNIEFLQSKGFSVTQQILDVKDIFSDSTSSLQPKSGVDVPEGHYEDVTMKATVVENRNIIFSSIVYGKALAWANRTEEKVDIFLGIHAGDHAIYPDCREESRLAAELCFRISNWGSERVSYCAPFVNLSKGQVLAAGEASATRIRLVDLSCNRIPKIKEEEFLQILENTNTCYNPSSDGKSCGKCGSCQERLEAFRENSLVDPVSYTV